MTPTSEESVVYLNGAWVPDSEAVVSIHDQSFVHGYGAFDTARTYGGRLIPGKVQQHLTRFFASAKALHIPQPMSKDEWAAIMQETVERNAHKIEAWGGDAWVFIRLTPGSKHFFGACDCCSYQPA